MKTVFKYFAICIAILLLTRIAFAFSLSLIPEWKLKRTVSNLQDVEHFTHEYIHKGVWTALDKDVYSFTECDTTKLNPKFFNDECGCYQWERHFGESWYAVSICPKDKMASIEVYFYSLLDMLSPASE